MHQPAFRIDVQLLCQRQRRYSLSSFLSFFPSSFLTHFEQDSTDCEKQKETKDFGQYWLADRLGLPEKVGRGEREKKMKFARNIIFVSQVVYNLPGKGKTALRVKQGGRKSELSHSLGLLDENMKFSKLHVDFIV